MDKNKEAFFALLTAGLWMRKVHLLPYEEVDFKALFQLAEEQSVLGIVTAGFENITDSKPQRKDVLQFIGRTVQLEYKNQAMNYFIGVLINKMLEAGIHTLLVKGQGVAQSYERPLWRSCGDVDFFLNADNYEKAKAFLKPLAASVGEEYLREKHIGMTIDSWVVELHGSLYCGLSRRIERELDEVYRDTFISGKTRIWMNDKVTVFMLAIENDVFYVFTHILQHFYKGGIGLRQLCDWCRLLWVNRTTIDVSLLERRLRHSGLMSEWKAFGAFAVDYLGMDATEMPMYSAAIKWKRKARRIKDFVMSVGSFGHNRGYSYYEEYPYLLRKCISFVRRVSDLLRHVRVFPLDSLRFFLYILINGIRSAVRGE